MARHIVCVLDRTVGHVSICWDYVSIFIYKNSNYNKINQISDTALKVFRSLYSFTTSVCHGAENYFPRLWGTGISAIFINYVV